MAKSLYITLRVIVDDLPLELRAAIADDTQTALAELPDLADASPAQIAGAVALAMGGMSEDTEVLVGAGVYVRLRGAEAVNAEWLDPTSH